MSNETHEIRALDWFLGELEKRIAYYAGDEDTQQTGSFQFHLSYPGMVELAAQIKNAQPELAALRAVAVAADKVLRAAHYDMMRGWQTGSEPMDDIVFALDAARAAGLLPDAQAVGVTS